MLRCDGHVLQGGPDWLVWDLGTSIVKGVVIGPPCLAEGRCLGPTVRYQCASKVGSVH